MNVKQTTVGVVVGVIVVVLLILGINALSKTPVISVNVPNGNLGAMASPASVDYAMLQGYTTLYPQKQYRDTATSTPCNFGPVVTPLVIKSLSVFSSSATSSSLTIRIATSTQPNATTTSITTGSINTSGPTIFVWKPASTDYYGSYALATSTYINVGIEGNGGVGSGTMPITCVLDTVKLE